MPVNLPVVIDDLREMLVTILVFFSRKDYTSSNDASAKWYQQCNATKCIYFLFL